MSDTRKSNAPIGMTRSELVMVTKDHEIKLSGSPIEQDLHPDYRCGDHRTSLTETYGICGVYNHTDGGYESQSDISSVSDDGFTITLDGTDGVGAGDLVEVIYYSSPHGTSDHLTSAQVGDVLTPETLDAAVQKINDCPPLDFKLAGMTFDRALCNSTTKPVKSTTTVVAKYAASQVGTWQTTDTPFYVTAIYFAWEGDTLPVDDNAVSFNIYVDGSQCTSSNLFFSDMQRILEPTAGWDQMSIVHIGLVECESDFRVDILIGDNSFDVSGGSWVTKISGWHL